MEKKIIKFEAEWCTQCKILDETLKEVVEKTGVELEKVDVEKEPELAAKFGVMGIPRTVIIDENGIIDDFAGLKPAQYFYDMLTED